MAWFTASRDDAATLLEDLGDGLDGGHVEGATTAIPVPDEAAVEGECEPDDDGYEFEVSTEWTPADTDRRTSVPDVADAVAPEADDTNDPGTDGETDPRHGRRADDRGRG